jgi:hypothetical protein
LNGTSFPCLEFPFLIFFKKIPGLFISGFISIEAPIKVVVLMTESFVVFENLRKLEKDLVILLLSFFFHFAHAAGQ